MFVKIPKSPISKILVKISAIFIFFICFFILYNHLTGIPYQKNEVSWYFHSESFDKFFIKHDIASHYWETFYAYDHPPITKYIFGLTLYLDDSNYIDKITALESVYGRWDFMLLHIFSPPDKEFGHQILLMRKINLVFTLLSLFLVLLLISTLIDNRFVLFVTPVVLSSNFIFYNSTLVGLPDIQFIFFTLLGCLFYIKYLNSYRNVLLIFFSIFVAISVATKLTGLLLLISYIVFHIYQAIVLRQLTYTRWKEIGIVGFIAFATWYVTNPTLYYSPVKNTVRYFAARIHENHALEKDMPSYVVDLEGKQVTLSCHALLSQCKSNQMIKSGSIFINIILFVLGVRTIIQSTKRKLTNSHIFLLIFMSLNFFSIFFITVNFYRYYLPAVIFVIPIQLLGLVYILREVKTLIFKPGNKIFWTRHSR